MDYLPLLGFSKQKNLSFSHLSVNRCRDVLMSTDLNNIAILNIHGVDYHWIIARITKSKTKYLLNTDLSEKSGSLSNINFLYHI